jgi:VWFA-related protein
MKPVASFSKCRGHLVLSQIASAAFLLILFPAIALHGQQGTSQVIQQPAQKQATPGAEQQAPAQQQPPQASPQQPPQVKIAVSSNMVTVFAIVHDKHGQVVSNLKKDDFSVDEDGHPEQVSYFARENDLPLTVGLLVDTSLSQRNVLGDERRASSTFVDHIMRPDQKDAAFLIHFDREVELLQDLTPSRQKLESALDLLEMPEPDQDQTSGQGGGQGGGRAGGRRGGYHGGGGTHLYDAVFLASDELMKKQQGRKALIVLSDGVDRGSKESLQTSIEAAQRANTIVYSILFKDDEGYGDNFGHHGGWGMGGPGMGGPHHYPQQREQRPDGKKILDRISKETGGRLFEVSKKDPVDKIYASIEQELRDQYVLGYTPDKSQMDAQYHKIHVSTKDKDLAVQARDGYYAQPSPAPASTPTAAPAPPAPATPTGTPPATATPTRSK